MKVFLSWSGDKSREVALILNEWLPNVMQWVKPFMSAEDIKKGARWSADVAKELEDTNFGIICVTPDNLNAPWISFEAGSLAKMIDESRVAPLIFKMKPSDISGPLLQFQATMFNRDEVKNLLWSINSAAPDEEKLTEPRLEKAFERWWPALEDEISKITFDEEIDRTKTASKKSTKSSISEKTENILEEILVLIRAQTKIINSPEDLFPQQYLGMVLRKYSQLQRMGGIHINPEVWVDIANQLRKLEELARPDKINKMTKKNISYEIRKITKSLNDPLMYLRDRFGRRLGGRLGGRILSTRELFHTSKSDDEQFEEIDTE